MINQASFYKFSANSGDFFAQTPGFFELPAMPVTPVILPGIITPAKAPKGITISAKDKKNYIENTTKSVMTTSEEMRQNFAKFLGVDTLRP